MTSNRNRFGYGVVFAIIIGIFLFQVIRYLHVNIDDQYITYKYAHSLAVGNGLTINPGERCEGFSSLLHLLIMSGFIYFGNFVELSPENIAAITLFSKLSGALAGIGVLLCGGLLLISFLALSPRQLFVALLPIALSIDCAFSASNGLETGLIMFIVTLFVTALFNIDIRTTHLGKWYWVALVSGLALVTLRVEGILMAGVFLFSRCCRSMSSPDGRRSALTAVRRLLVPFSGLFVALTLFRRIYFGDIIPNTYHVKIPSLSLFEEFTIHNGDFELSTTPFAHMFTTLGDYVLPAVWGWFLLFGAIVFFSYVPQHVPEAGWRSCRRWVRSKTDRNDISPMEALFVVGIPCFLMAIVSAYIGGDWMPGHRFIMHVFPVGMILINGTIVAMLGRLRPNAHAYSGVSFVISLVYLFNLTTIEGSNKPLLLTLASNSNGKPVQGINAFYVLHSENRITDDLLLYVPFLSRIRDGLDDADAVAVFEAGMASLLLAEKHYFIDLSGLTNRHIRPTRGEQFVSSSKHRYYINCGNVHSATDRYLLSKAPRYIVFDSFTLKGCPEPPEHLLGRQYRQIETNQGNGTGFFAVYERQ